MIPSPASRWRALCVAFIGMVAGCDAPVDPMHPPIADQQLVDLAGDGRGMLFGPEMFVRSTGAPVTEVREFDISGFEGPFALHLRNGDSQGEHRVTAAWLTLNGKELLGPSDFGHKVYGHDLEVELIDPSVLTIRIAGKPGSFMAISIDGQLLTQVTLDERGGSFPLLGGDVILDVPAGAVSGDVTLTVEPATSLPSGPIPVSGTALDLGPDGFVFNLPIQMTVSYDPAALPAAALERALRLYITESGDWKETGSSSVDLVANTVTGMVSHFSHGGVLSSRVCPGDPTAFNTFAEAIAAVEPGGTVEVCGGDYDEAIVIDKGLTLRADGTGPARIAPTAGPSAVVEVSTLDVVVIEDLEIEAPGFRDAVMSEEFRDLTLDGLSVFGGGIVLLNEVATTGGRASAVVRNSTFDGGPSSNMSSALFLLNDVDALVENNIVRRTTFSCIQLQIISLPPVTFVGDVIGNDLDECGVNGAIRAAFFSGETSTLNIVGNTLANSTGSSWAGIYWFGGGSGTIERNFIIDYVKPSAQGPAQSGIFLTADVAPSVRFNDIAGNAFTGLKASTTTTIDATCNWWGVADGPSGTAGGTGDAVSGNVDVIPFATAPIAGTSNTACSGGL